MALCRKEGIANILVSNGCVSPAAAAEVLALTDAANVDLKCFSEETYAKTLGGNLFGVLHFIKEAYTAGVHLEITTLIVPGLNDSPGETRRCAEFISGLSREIPWHISAYHPDYHWDAPPTSPAALGEIARMGRDLLSHVYTGNISGEINNTPCPHCGAVLIHRRGYQVDTGGLILKEDDGKKVYTCAQCGQAAPVRY
jgi:pyruvate formate lyase activating enzyme